MSRSLNVVATHRMLPASIAFAEEHGLILTAPSEERFSRDALAAELLDAQAVVVFMPDRVDREFLALGPGLEIVAAALKGYDNIDIEACTEHGAWLSYVPDHLTEATAELAIGLALGLMRRILVADRDMRGGEFEGWRPTHYGDSLFGARVGILGMGRVGRSMHRRLVAMGSHVAFCDPEVEAVDGVLGMPLPDLLARSTVLFLAAPLAPATTRLLDGEALDRLPAGAYLVNVARGSIVDEAAVAERLASGRLRGYAADVFELEDRSLPERAREVHPGLRVEDGRSVLTPHLGSAVREVRGRIERDALASVLDLARGQQPRNALNDPRARA